MTLATITEDQIANGGHTVASILATHGGDRITDVDSGAVEGIAVTALDSGNGSWEYSTNGGGSWAAVGAVSNTSALLLRSTDLIRFVPNGQNATTAAFTFRAWDQTSGTFGTKVDVSTNGGTTAFSAATETAAITVTALNDAPVLDTAGAATLTQIDEGDIHNSGDTVAAIIASAGGDPITDVDSGAVEGIAITWVDNSNGTWEYSTNGGASWNAIGTVSDASAFLLTDAATNRIRFVPVTNFNGDTQLTYRAWDRTDGNTNATAGVNVTANGGTTAYSGACGDGDCHDPATAGRDVPLDQ